MQNTAECFGPPCVGCNPPRRPPATEPLPPLPLKQRRAAHLSSAATTYPPDTMRQSSAAADAPQPAPSRVCAGGGGLRRTLEGLSSSWPIRFGPLCYIGRVPNVVSTGSSEISLAGREGGAQGYTRQQAGRGPILRYNTARYMSNRPCPGAHGFCHLRS